MNKKRRTEEEVERKCHVFRNHFAVGHEKRKTETLINLKKLAATRQFLSSSMQKYGVGQAVALRISHEFIRVNGKIKKAVDKYNLIVNPEDSLQLEDCLCYDNEIYASVGKCNISFDKIQCIDALSAMNRANIELSNINQHSFGLFFIILSGHSKCLRTESFDRNVSLFAQNVIQV